MTASERTARGHGAMVTGAVIAGGRSGRLGTDKRFVEVDGLPLLARTVAVLRPIVDDLRVVVARPSDRAPIVAALTEALGQDAGAAIHVDVDARSGVGPAAGLEAALAAAGGEVVLVVATDHPALDTDVLRLLIDRALTSTARAVALAGPRGPEPFLAVYRRDALALVAAALDDGVRRMQDVLAALDPEPIEASEWRTLDPSGRTLMDIDVPADLDGFR